MLTAQEKAQELPVTPPDNSSTTDGAQHPGQVPADSGFHQISPDHVPLGKEWIGIVGRSVPGALRAHLPIKDGQGYLIEEVAPEGPAAKAGLKKYDIVLSVNGKPVNETMDLIKLVNAHGDAALEFVLLRGGDDLKLEVTPEKRPESQYSFAPGPRDGQRARQRWFERMPGMRPPGPDARGDQDRMRFRSFFRPGAVVEEIEQEDFPADISISILKTDDGPVKITVKKGDQTWETTEDKLEVLPEAIRPHVERMIAPRNFTLRVPNQAFPPGNRHLYPGPDFFPGRGLDEQIENRFRHLEQQLEQLFQDQGQQPTPKSESKEELDKKKAV